MKLYGLIGRNIDYSFSRKYFSEKFNNENIDAKYRNFDLEDISQLTDIIKEEEIAGLNVTIPYKRDVMLYLDRLDENAKEIGAVNTIKFEENGKLAGYNTDHFGFRKSIEPFLKKHHQKALILGTGGASKAVAFALKSMEIEFKFVSREPREDQFSYTDLNKNLLEEYSVIINTTPLGTFPNIQESPDVPVEFLGKKHLVYDLIYNPAETAIMKMAIKQGATAVNGLRMLQLQAEKAWEIWNS
ncbi:shikimate dehydrogenase [Christiangramia fulva]|uniref:Shikimate dehydrogenase n=1 Tax=Christiangramia fulva TaxID=2126553 RepID=A0A2R3Z6J3_9FLAO|nr:shikimate dehydrogenase [Christiangramia fulva]AVR45913.1 shikimate dehydrogenase [Christiangramia fulva]